MRFAHRRSSMPYWHAMYTAASYEPYGELTSMTTPLGYTRTFSYAAAQQGGADYGLPTADHGRPGVPGHTIPHHHPRTGLAKSSERGAPVPGLPPSPEQGRLLR